MIYLDHAASAPMLPQALDAQLSAAREAFANPGAVHRAASIPGRLIRQGRKSIAKLLDFPDNGLFFTSGGSESNNWAIKMTALASRDRGRHIIVGSTEHKSVLNAAKALEPLGFTVTALPVSPEGYIIPEVLESAIRPETLLISLQSVNNETGIIQDVKTFSLIAKRHGILYHCDAVQSFGHVELPLHLADLVTISAHKLGGPAGVGALAIRPGTPILPLIHGGGQEFGLRSGTENAPGIAGFAAACETVFANLKEEAARQRQLQTLLLEKLQTAVPSLRVNGSGERAPHILNLGFPGLSGEELLMRLDLLGICISSGAACAARDSRPSHVLLAMGLSETEAKESVRISIGCSTTQDEMEQAADAIISIYQKYAQPARRR
ncbi:MAG: cysteine desulfurase [Oscillospiraceae bacterium]|nr:cysteine desulfurase [Oscillospiraceae bacterium]